jgi:hypothetical protein
VILKNKKLQIPERFDPFTDRRARDIRNSLSEAFVATIAAQNPDGYLKIAQHWREKNLSSRHADYIADRLLRYKNALDAIQSGEFTDPLQQAVAIWNQGLYFEFHDHLEDLWKDATGDKRQALKGLIKAAAVYIHLEQDHQQAAESLALKAHALLQQYCHCLTFIANTETLLTKLKTGEPQPPQLEISSFYD